MDVDICLYLIYFLLGPGPSVNSLGSWQGKTMKMLDPTEAEQIILDQMDDDAARHQGPRTILVCEITSEHWPRSIKIIK